MPIEVAQLRPQCVDSTITFARGVGLELKPLDVDLRVSLVAKQDGEVVATVLGVHSNGGACVLHVCLAQPDEDGTVTGDLLNKALMKVHGAGVRRCQIEHHGQAEAAHWASARWDLKDEKTPSGPGDADAPAPPTQAAEAPELDAAPEADAA